MKRCPVCGSIVSDSEDTCGVCGKGLYGTPSLETGIEEEELKDQRIEKTQAIETARRAMRRAVIALSGSIGTIALGVGLVLFSGFGNIWLVILGLLFLPFGAWLLANIVMGGLGRGAWKDYVAFWARHPAGGLIETTDKLQEERHGILNPEEMEEDKGVREERKKEEFD